jgi:muramoyltetrapeptide carboxypeptidase LdcA involved in peptidoglycan recycling
LNSIKIIQCSKELNKLIRYNVKFGHAQPRCIIPYGIETEIDLDKKAITLNKNNEGESSDDGGSP